MITVLLGLGGAVLFGASDFIGGIASRVTSPLKVTAVSALTGLLLLSSALAITGGSWSREAVLFGALSGMAVGIALALLYASLAIGPMSILSPLTGVASAVVPMTAGLLRGEQLGPVGYLALAAALIAVALIGFSPDGIARPSVTGLVTATGAGIMFGAFLILIDLTPSDSGLIPLVFARAAMASLMALVILGMVVMRAPRRITPSAHAEAIPSSMRFLASPAGAPSWKVGLRLAVACGVVDAVANTLQLAGLRAGDLSVMSVLNAMYPVGTIILAALVMRERVTPLQGVGLILALLAGALFALT